MPTDIQTPQKYVDLPELSEIYANGLRIMLFDGHSFRIELTATRPCLPAPNKHELEIYPAARLVLSPAIAIELRDQLSNLISLLQEQGTLTLNAPSSSRTKQ
jgi:hypothetical protein